MASLGLANLAVSNEPCVSLPQGSDDERDLDERVPLAQRQAAYDEEHDRLAGADSPDGRDFQDGMTLAQIETRERSIHTKDAFWAV